MNLPIPQTLMGLAHHIEIEHERELAPPADKQLRAMHDEMHTSDHWNHTHRKYSAGESV